MRRISQLFVIALLLFMVLFLALLLVNATHAAEPAKPATNPWTNTSPWFFKGPPSLIVNSGSQARFVLTPEGQITFYSNAGKELAVLHPDGTVKLYGKPEESARVFWAAMARFRPDCERPHALTAPSGYNAPHGQPTQTLEGRVQRATPLAPSLTNGNTDTHRGNRPSASEGAGSTRVHPQAPPTTDSGTDGIF